MTDLPTKDEIVERVSDVLRTSESRIWDYGETSEAALDALTVPDLLSELARRGVPVHPYHDPDGNFFGWSVGVVRVEKPDD